MENQELYDMLSFTEGEDGLILHDFREGCGKDVEELWIPDSWGVIAIQRLEEGLFNTPFRRCNGLKKVRLPSTLRTLSKAFQECQSLSEVIFPEGMEMKELGACNFQSCKSLTSVTLPDDLVRIQSGNFEFSGLCHNSEYADKDHNFYVGKYFLRCGIYTVELTVREGTVLVADAACYGKRSLRRVFFPSSLRIIGKNAFYACENLESPILPESVESIGDFAFFRDEVHNILKGVNVAQGEYDENGRFCISKVPGMLLPEEKKRFAALLKDSLLKIDFVNTSSYDDSDDSRATSSESRWEYTSYYSVDIEKDSDYLIRTDGELRGVVFYKKASRGYDITPHAFFFDGSVSQCMTLGYSASHSSQYTSVIRVSLVKKGENGAPMKAGSVSFVQSQMYPSF